VKRPGNGSSRTVKRTLTIFCGLLGVSRSFEARKVEAVTVSWSSFSVLANTNDWTLYLEGVLSEACDIVKLVEKYHCTGYSGLWSEEKVSNAQQLDVTV